jgi:hypothetical protein
MYWLYSALYKTAAGPLHYIGSMTNVIQVLSKYKLYLQCNSFGILTEVGLELYLGLSLHASPEHESDYSLTSSLNLNLASN